MQDFARLRIAFRVGRGRLRCRQKAQNSFCHVRSKAQKFQRRNDAIAPKCRTEPRHTCKGVKAQRRSRQHHLKIGTITDLIHYRSRTESLVMRVTEREIDTVHGRLRLRLRHATTPLTWCA